MPGSAAFIIDIAGAKLHRDPRRNAIDEAQSAGGFPGQKDPLALSSQRAILPQLLLHHRWRFTLASLTRGACIYRRNTVLLNVRQHPTRFWLRTRVESNKQR